MKGKGKQKPAVFLSPLATPARAGTNRSVTPISSRSTSPVPPRTALAPPPAANSPLVSSPETLQSGPGKNKQERALQAASSFQTILTIAEKILDGLDVWGPSKAIAGVAGEVLKATRLKVENDDTIKEMQCESEHLMSLFSESEEASNTLSTPAELQSRIEKLRGDIASHMHELDQYQVAKQPSEHSGLKAKLNTWLTAGKEVLASEAIAAALPDVSRKIADSIRDFMLQGQIRSEATMYSIDGKVTDMHNDMKKLMMRNENITSFGSRDHNDPLMRLNPIMSALHNAEGAAQVCLQGTCEKLLSEVEAWFRNLGAASIFWLSGMAGTGKTTVAQSICNLLRKELGASFFFSRNDADRRRPSSILPTIAYQLAYSQPALRPVIYDALAKDPNLALQSVRAQAQKLLFEALGSKSADFPTILLVFDALDECDKHMNQEGGEFIPHLLHFLRLHPSRFKVVVTSRPESSIRAMFERGEQQMCPHILYNIDRDTVPGDIELYLRHELSELAARQDLERVWPVDLRESQVKRLAELADRLFIFAATVVKALTNSSFPTKTIEMFLGDFASSSNSLFGTLDSMYLQIVCGVIPIERSEEEATQLREDFHSIVGAIVSLQEPLDFSTLGKLLDVEEYRLQAIIRPLHSVIDVDKTNQRPIRIFHPSFFDFLVDDARCTDSRFRILPHVAHPSLSLLCLRVMTGQLKPNICDIQDRSLLNAEVDNLPERLKRHVSGELRYACLHWWGHLIHIKIESVTEELTSELEKFTTGLLLQWIEVLSLVGGLQSALIGLPKILEWCKDVAKPGKNSQSGSRKNRIGRLHQFVGKKLPKAASWFEDVGGQKWPSSHLRRIATAIYDVHRMAQSFFYPISISALHVYESAVTFMPRCSLVPEAKELQPLHVRMTSERRDQWGQDMSIMEGHTDELKQVILSPDGSLVASRSYDGTIRIWDFASGAQVMCIQSGSEHLVFSPDCMQLLSLAVGHKALETWDVVSGNMLNMFHLQWDDDSPYIHSRAISPTGDRASIGLKSGKVCVFGFNGNATQLQEHKDRVNTVVFSLDGSQIASGSDDETVRVWEVESSRCIAVLHGREEYPILHVNISSDGSRILALGKKRGYDRIKFWAWDMETQQAILSFAPKYHMDHPIAPSFDSMRFAYPLDDDQTLCISDVTSGRRLSVLAGHIKRITTSAFSPSGSYVVSGSKDSTIRAWDTRLNTTTESSFVEGHKHEICDFGFSTDGAKLISVSPVSDRDGDSRVVCCWNTRSGKMTSRIEKRAQRVGFSATGAPIALYWKDESEEPKIYVWNAETGKAVATLRGHSDQVNDVVFSSGGARIASRSDDQTVQIWDTVTWKCTAILSGHARSVGGVCFSPDGSRVVSGSRDRTARVWDAATGNQLAVLEGHKNEVVSVRFSPDGLRIFSQGWNEHEREWRAGVDFPPPTTTTTPAPPTFDLDDSGWLLMSASPSSHNRRLCWLPVERRGMIQSSGLTVALGSALGVVTILSILLTAS